MKILIAYATKGGTTRECAEEIKSNFKHDIDIINLKDASQINLDNYQWVIIGTPVYAGMIEKDVRKFIKNNMDALTPKLLGFYTCGLGDDRESYDAVLKVTDIIKNTKVYKHLGGEVHPENMKGFIKIIAGLMAKSSPGQTKRDKNKVKEFTEQMQNCISGDYEENS